MDDSTKRSAGGNPITEWGMVLYANSSYLSHSVLAFSARFSMTLRLHIRVPHLSGGHVKEYVRYEYNIKQGFILESCMGKTFFFFKQERGTNLWH